MVTTPKGNLGLAYTLATNTFKFLVSDIFKEPSKRSKENKTEKDNFKGWA